MRTKFSTLLPRLCVGLLCGVAPAALLVWASPAEAAVANLTPVADTFINSGMTNNNAGKTAWFDAGTDGTGGVRRGLLRFDLSTIPAGSTITSAVVQLTATKVPANGAVDSTFDLFRLLAGWNEGAKAGNNGATASTGEATWNDRMRGTGSWTTPGAKKDAAGTASASVAVTSADNAKYSWSGSGLVADVQLWVDNPSQNFGWLLTSRAEGSHRSVRGFASRESGGTTGTLVVNYTTPAPPPPPPPNVPPSVSITSPADGATFVSPASVTIQVAASDSDGTIAKVEFFDGSNSLGVDTTSPYSLAATLYPGTHTLGAVATDNAAGTTIAGTVTVTVNTVPISDPIPAHIEKDQITIELQTVVDGLAAPLSLAVPDDGSRRMFVCDQAGLAWVVVNGSEKLPTPLLDVRSRLVTFGNYDERGLLGLATHPNFAKQPLVYTYTSEPIAGTADFPNVIPAGVTNNHQSVIAEWRMDPADPNRIDPASRRELLRIDKPQSNHNGGTLRFGPDGFLYISLGDGGRANDVADGHVPGGNAQSLQRIWGKLLRIDVDGHNSANGKYGIPKDNPFVGQNAVQEIYAYGLRNPYTYSFDSLTGQLYLGDAGQNKIEEVDLITKGGNYGWNTKEGTFWFDSVTANIGSVVTGPVRPVPPGLIDPIVQYDHDEGLVVIGGFVYRGCENPVLDGRYVFGDWGSFAAPSARLFFLDPNLVIKELRIGLADRPTGFWLRGFGQDADGELYAFVGATLGPTGTTGQMLKIVPRLPIVYFQENLVSDLPGVADRTDPNLVNPWGIAHGPTTPFWIADNHNGVSSIYDGNGVQARAPVAIPGPAGSKLPGAPTGIVFNSTTDFIVGPNQPAKYIFATEDGTIAAWNSGTSAVLKVDLSALGTVYKGLALGSSGGKNYLYAANFNAGRVEVFDANFAAVALAGSFTDPNLPAQFAPFNIQDIGGKLYVTYAKPDAAKHDDVSGPGNGFVNVFDTSGQFVKRLVSQGALNSPWGVVLAPAGFGGFGGALLVGNFGDGLINAFNPTTGAWLGALRDGANKPLSIDGLWGLAFGNGAKAGDTHTLFFTAGIAGGGNVEDHGLFGRITPIPPSVLNAMGDAQLAVASSPNGRGGVGPAYYDGQLFNINLKHMPAEAAAALIAHNQSINNIYVVESSESGEEELIPVLDAIQGDGFNPLWREVLITPATQFTSDNDVLAAAAAGDITLTQTDELYRCSVVGPSQ